MKRLSQQTAGKSIPFRIKRADTFLSRLKGLMFRRQPLQQEGLWLLPCSSIHMCFMNFSIDAVFLDKNNRVVRLASHVKPWRFIAPVTSASSVLELPAGSIEMLHLQTGDTLHL
ncbi:DUF192 domain-containing protein [Ectobacillus ponti]|uniref:DUF192 domain-containing protein n=1 Tax=Ectobacillus ponti TaxID=2961894 RepID=UPI0034D2A847